MDPTADTPKLAKRLTAERAVEFAEPVPARWLASPKAGKANPLQNLPYRKVTGYASYSGTSMATPHVAAAAALVLARYPSRNAAWVKDRLRDTATRLPKMKRAWTADYGHGLLNLRRALL